jgi:hypothetical protein
MQPRHGLNMDNLIIKEVQNLTCKEGLDNLIIEI